MPHRLTDELLLVYVDDELPNLKVFEANFKGQFRLATCSSGAEALTLLKARGHEVGIVVTDQRMPGMTGVELLEKV
ncbi:MAG: response regulator, partial [Archangium sp.]|nr:response regulator [Archangium sp.]